MQSFHPPHSISPPRQGSGRADNMFNQIIRPTSPHACPPMTSESMSVVVNDGEDAVPPTAAADPDGVVVVVIVLTVHFNFHSSPAVSQCYFAPGRDREEEINKKHCHETELKSIKFYCMTFDVIWLWCRFVCSLLTQLRFY